MDDPGCNVCCMGHVFPDGFIPWGLYDGHTWLTGKNPLLLDANYNTKPAYNALMTSLGRPTL